MEQAKKRDHKIYITDTAIEKISRLSLSDYSDTQNTKMLEKHRELLKYAKEANDSNEVLFICDTDFISEVRIKGTEFKVSPGKNPFAVSILMQAELKTLVYMHNHPSINNFSFADIDTFICEGTVKTMTVVTNQGVVYALNKTAEYNYDKARRIMLKVYNTFDNDVIDNKEFVKRFLKTCYEGGIEYVKS